VHCHSRAGAFSGNVANNIFLYFRNSQIQERFGGLALTTFDVVNMVSGLIFNRRFNSCVENNVLAAIDVNANGAVFVYDEFGGFRRVAYAVVGPESVSDFVERFLLNSRTDDLDESNIAGILHEAFIGATERNLETGVQLDIRIIGSSGAVKRITQDLPL
jgi:20S proteasome alpha/beta subunit